MEAENTTLPHSHTIFLRIQVHIKSTEKEREREREREEVAFASTLFVKKLNATFFLYFTLHHFLLSVPSSGKKIIMASYFDNCVTPNNKKRHFIFFTNFALTKQNLVIIAFTEQGLYDFFKKPNFQRGDLSIVSII